MRKTFKSQLNQSKAYKHAKKELEDLEKKYNAILDGRGRPRERGGAGGGPAGCSAGLLQSAGGLSLQVAAS